MVIVSRNLGKSEALKKQETEDKKETTTTTITFIILDDTDFCQKHQIPVQSGVVQSEKNEIKHLARKQM